MAKTSVSINPNPIAVLDAVRSIAEAAAEYGKVKQQEKTKREQIRVNRDIVIKQIDATREILLKSLDQDFDLRSRALDKQLDLIERALDDNNSAVLDSCLRSLEENIKCSPLQNLSRFQLDFHDDKKVIEI